MLEGETSKVHRLVKIPKADLMLWDAEHDVLGQKLGDVAGSVSDDVERIKIQKKEG